MLFFMFSLLLEPGLPAKTFIQTGEIGMVNLHQTALAGDGSVYVLSLINYKIKKFDARGQLVKTFGGKGQGPGEFNYPTRLFIENDRIYVWDIEESRFSEFHQDGTFMAWKSPPRHGVDIVRKRGGWAYGTWVSAVKSEPNAVVTLFLADEEFKQVQPIAESRGNGYGATFIAERGKSIYTPVHPVPKLEVSRDGKRIYLLSPTTLDVTIFDENGNPVGQLKKNMPRLPFNPDWANIRLEEVKRIYRDRTYQTSYYKEFPVVRSFLASPGGDLVFRLWTFEPHKTDKTIALRENGSASNLNLPWRDWHRWLAQDGDRVLLARVNPETELCELVWCPGTNIERFMQDHPSSDEE